MIVDTHCHLYDEAFRPDFDDVLTRAREAGLEACVMPGIDRSCHESLVAMADALPGFAFPCIGLHPTSVSETWEEELAFVKEHFADRRWYAVGEIGLDEYWSKDFDAPSAPAAAGFSRVSSSSGLMRFQRIPRNYF